MKVDVRESKFGKYADDYARHRAGFPESFFNRVLQLDKLNKNSTLLDLGTGTGTLARRFSKEGLCVTGLDIDKEMIKASQERDRIEEVNVKYIQSSANKIPLEGQSFDIISAGQCWHWFSLNAIDEVERILKPSGKLLIAYFDWISKAGNPVDLMYKLKSKYVPDEGSNLNRWPLGYYPQKADDLQFKNFELQKTYLWEEDISYTQESWLGRLRAYSGLSSRLSSKEMDNFIDEYNKILRDHFPNDTLEIPHKIWFGFWKLK